MVAERPESIKFSGKRRRVGERVINVDPSTPSSPLVYKGIVSAITGRSERRKRRYSQSPEFSSAIVDVESAHRIPCTL